MLFTYRYLRHDIEKMHEYIEYIFYNVWCVAPGCDYSNELYRDHDELYGIIEKLTVVDHAVAENFISSIEKIFAIFKQLSQAEITSLRSWFEINNNIERLCDNAPPVQAFSYDQLEQINAKLKVEMKNFFMELYSEKILGYSAFKEKIGDIDDHYSKFITYNQNHSGTDVCPYCGMSDLSNEHASTREAYDHYVSKGKYPFNSINFKNLAPMCHKCNSSYKSTRDPLYSRTGLRRKSFYSYKDSYPLPNIQIEINKDSYEDLNPDDININIESQGYQEQIATWMDVFRIEERYKEKLCGKTAKYWITKVLEEYNNYGERINALDNEFKSISKYPLLEQNFLKEAFYKAVKNKIRELSKLQDEQTSS